MQRHSYPGAPSLRSRAGFLVGAALALGATAAHADSEVQALALVTGVLVVAAVVTPERLDSDHLAIEVGRFDAIKDVQPANALSIEYHFGQALWWKLRPFVGAGATSDRSGYAYAGIRLSTWWGPNVEATPSFAVGGYSRGEGKNLGSPPVLGRFGVDFAYRFDNDLRLGVAYHHMSNGKAFGQTVNPGTEVVGVTLSVPL